jgi:hypothetical protein
VGELEMLHIGARECELHKRAYQSGFRSRQMSGSGVWFGSGYEGSGQAFMYELILEVGDGVALLCGHFGDSALAYCIRSRTFVPPANIF